MNRIEPKHSDKAKEHTRGISDPERLNGRTIPNAFLLVTRR